MNFNFKNKKILITGSSGGIGSALSEKFISLGGNIIFTSSSEDKLTKLEKLYGSEHSYYLLNLSSLFIISLYFLLISFTIFIDV